MLLTLGPDYHIEGDRAAPQILMSTEGYQFGFGGHFDAGCSATISYQLQASKLWRVWSPWEIPADRTGARGSRRLVHLALVAPVPVAPFAAVAGRAGGTGQSRWSTVAQVAEMFTTFSVDEATSPVSVINS